MSDDAKIVREIVANAIASMRAANLSSGQGADRAINALQAAGFKILPREPTESMKLAGTQIAPTWDYEANAVKYRAMWDAA